MWAWLSMAADEIENRKQENPHDVDEVPVETADLDGTVVIRRDDPARAPPQHPRHDPEADDHVNRMEPGHDEVEREENLRVLRLLGRLEREAGTRNVACGLGRFAAAFVARR